MSNRDPASTAVLTVQPYINQFEAAYAQAEKLRASDPLEAARAHQSALALHMTVELCMRQIILASIDVSTDLIRDSRGRVARVRLAGKLGCYERALSKHLAKCLQRHLDVHWPRLADAECTLLFPSRPRVVGAHCIRRAIAELLLASSSPLCDREVGA